MGPVVENRVLRGLGAQELAEVRSRLEPIALAVGQPLGARDHTVPPLVFVESGLVSCFSGETGRDQTEVALIGRDGAVGLPAVLGARTDPFSYVVQREGAALRLSAEGFAAVQRLCAGFTAALLRYSHAFILQVAETGRANARHTVAARLARWLLMAHDRIDGDEIVMTHESLSLVLGVRRPGVTVALHLLEGERLIRARRGVITILDRAGLLAMAGQSYGLAERTYPDLLARETRTVTAGAEAPHRLRPAPEAV